MDKVNTLYKYKTFDFYSKSLLINNQIYLSSCSQFNDPFDAIPPFKFRNENRTYEDELQKLLKEGAEKEFGIMPLTSKCDSILMWSHYANNHEGFCIGYNVDKLIESIDYYDPSIDSNPTACIKQEIVYSKLVPEFGSFESNYEKVIKLFTTKFIDWQYEEEYRIFKINACRKLIKLEDGTIKEIILGCKMNSSDEKEIIEIVRQKHPYTAISKAEMSSEEFEIVIK